MYDISVVIPVYNVEKYIRQCLDSIVAQSLGIENIEVIIVNDATPDNSMAIVEEFASKYPSFKIINNETNVGPGECRNRGLKLVTSDYVTFVDSDDFISPNIYENSLKKMKNNDCDLLIYNWEFYQDGARIENNSLHKHGLNKNHIFNSVKECPSLMFMTSIWNKIFHKNLFKYIKFPKREYEDNEIAVKSLINANKIYFNNDDTYFYRKRSNSITTNIKEKNINDMVGSIKTLLKLARQYPEYKENIEFLSLKFTNDVFFWIFFHKWYYDEEIRFLNLVRQIASEFSIDLIDKYGENFPNQLLFKEELLNLDNYDNETYLAKYKYFNNLPYRNTEATFTFNLEDGSSEDFKIKYDLKRQNSLTLDLSKYNNIKSIRFDPLELAFCKVKIINISAGEVVNSNCDLDLSGEYSLFYTLDPYFIISGEFNNISQFKIDFSLEIIDKDDLNIALDYKDKVIHNQLTNFTGNLYVDNGKGFNEEDKLSINYSIKELNTLKFDLTNFKDIKSLRFDPLELEFSKVKINSITSDGSNIVINEGNYDFKKENFDVFTTLDPYYFISGDFKDSSFIEISFEIEILNKKDLAGIFDSKNNKINMCNEQINELKENKNKKSFFSFKK